MESYLTELEETSRLKQILLDEYGHFSDKRIKKLGAGSQFIIDDRNKNDLGANGQVYSTFCTMFLDVRSSNEVILTLMNCPTSPDIEKWFSANAIAFGQNGKAVAIMKGEQDCIKKLEALVGLLASWGGRYDVPHYKYTAPRVSDSLTRLRHTLTKAWPIKTMSFPLHL